MTADALLVAIDALHPLDRERAAQAMLDHVTTHALLAEVRSRYFAVDDASVIVHACKRILADEAEIRRDMDAMADKAGATAEAAP